MFKKRGLPKSNQPFADQQPNIKQQAAVEPKHFDLRKDIEEIEKEYEGKDCEQEKQEKNDLNDGESQRLQEPLHKTKPIHKFNARNSSSQSEIRKSKNNSLGEKISAKIANEKSKAIFHPEQQKEKNQQLSKPLQQAETHSYGLMDRSQFKSSHERQDHEDYDKGMKKRVNQGLSVEDEHESLLTDLYVKKKMEEMKKKATETLNLNANEENQPVSGTYTLKEKSNWEEILQIQKQYLNKDEKIKDYDVYEVQKKLQRLAHQTIKKEVEKRAAYLKDLLENEHQRTTYASKKELKMAQQEKQRLQRELNSRYRERGRKSFIENLKNSAI